MDRRTFLQCSALGVALTACGDAGMLESSKQKKTNVLFIAIDDLNSWIGCLGHLREGVPVAKTPNIDRLASQGALFTNAHTPVPWCMPARNNMFAGLYANQSGLFNTEALRDLQPTIQTLPQHFMQQGYTTLAAGKLFHDSHPDPQSWNHLEQFARPDSQKSKKPRLNQVAGLEEGDGFDWGQIALPETEFADVQIADRVIQHLQIKHSQPFFLAAGFRFPHLPWYLPQEILDLYPLDSIELPWVRDDDLNDLPESGKRMAFSSPFTDTVLQEKSDHYYITKADGWKKAVQAYLAAITFADAQLGRVIDALDGSEYAHNTHVVLWSDNGFHLGEKLHWRKFTLWDQATRVPLIIRTAGQSGSNKIIDQAVSLVDIYPTLVDLCGLPQPRHVLSGESLVPFLQSTSVKKMTPAIITYGRGNNSVVDEHWRYIRYADGAEELYDHRVDPHEWNNLAVNPEWIKEKNRLSSWLKDV